MFRLFRWSADASPDVEQPRIPLWVRLPDLPIGLFHRACIRSIINTFADFINIDKRTEELSSLRFARACIEVDVRESLPEKVRVELPGGKSFMQRIVLEGSRAYCAGCKKHGHVENDCRASRRNGSRSPAVAHALCPTPYAPDPVSSKVCPTLVIPDDMFAPMVQVSIPVKANHSPHECGASLSVVKQRIVRKRSKNQVARARLTSLVIEPPVLVLSDPEPQASSLGHHEEEPSWKGQGSEWIEVVSRSSMKKKRQTLAKERLAPTPSGQIQIQIADTSAKVSKTDNPMSGTPNPVTEELSVTDLPLAAWKEAISRKSLKKGKDRRVMEREIHETFHSQIIVSGQNVSSDDGPQLFESQIQAIEEDTIVLDKANEDECYQIEAESPAPKVSNPLEKEKVRSAKHNAGHRANPKAATKIAAEPHPAMFVGKFGQTTLRGLLRKARMRKAQKELSETIDGSV